MFYILYVIFILPLLILLPTTVKGKKHIKECKDNFILTCNHTSNWDAIIMQGRLPKRYFMLGKAELFENKLLRALLKSLNAYPVKRGQNDIQSIKLTLRKLNAGENLLIFPQGTRVKQTEYLDIKNGTAMLALKTKKPIIPSVFVKDTKIFRHNTLIVGQAYNLSEMEHFKDKPITKELLNDASDIIVSKIMQLKTNYLEDKTNAKRHRDSSKCKKTKNN